MIFLSFSSLFLGRLSTAKEEREYHMNALFWAATVDRDKAKLNRYQKL